MVAAFGSGVMFSLVSGSGNSHANVITTGVFFALCQGVLFKVNMSLRRNDCLSIPI
ncbi:putative mitochondrial import inner membrane translocase subunit TIM22 [Helianthus anomalus]